MMNFKRNGKMITSRKCWNKGKFCQSINTKNKSLHYCIKYSAWIHRSNIHVHFRKCKYIFQMSRRRKSYFHIWEIKSPKKQSVGVYFWQQGILSAELTKTNFFRLFFWRFSHWVLEQDVKTTLFRRCYDVE